MKQRSTNRQSDREPSRPRNSKVGLVGLGLMGMALAERLIQGGFEVWGCDLDPKRVRLLHRLGGNSAADAATVAACCPRILLSLPDSRAVQTVLTQMRPYLKRGQIIIDTSTGDPASARTAGSELARRHIYYLDATISGSSSQVLRKEVVVLAGGPTAAYSACLDIFRAFARQSFWLGPSGSGSMIKLVSNLVLGLNRAALAEGLFFGTRLGLDPRTVLQVLRETMAYSRIMDTKGEKMINADFTPQARLSQHLKDVRLILAAGAAAGAKLPLSQTHCKLLNRAVAKGYGSLDNSAVICAFEAVSRGRPRSKKQGS